MASQTSALAAPFEWQRTTPADAGFAPAIDARLDKLIAEKRAWGLHSVLVARSRRILMERHFEGGDEAWGRRLGSVKFDADTLHDLRSVSKSIVALVYGIARAEKKVPPPEAPPELELVVVVTAGNYSTSDNWMPPSRVLREVILSSLL